MKKTSTFKIELKLDDAAQQEDTNAAIVNILENIARRFKRGDVAKEAGDKIYDVNGNPIGTWKISR